MCLSSFKSKQNIIIGLPSIIEKSHIALQRCFSEGVEVSEHPTIKSQWHNDHSWQQGAFVFTKIVF